MSEKRMIDLEALQRELEDIDLELSSYESRVIEAQTKIRQKKLPTHISKELWFRKKAELENWRINKIRRKREIEGMLKSKERRLSTIMEEILTELKTIKDELKK